jgi:hypothetical protein
MAAYARTNESDIADGLVIEAVDLNAEFDAIVASIGGSTIQFGGTADVQLEFGTEASSGHTQGILTWMEDEDYFRFSDAINVGVDGTGYDVKFFGDTTGKSLLWDESADSLIVTGTTTLVGTTNLDATDIDGAVQIDATFTSGVDGQGYDTKFFGDTASAYMLWDTSEDDLVFAGAAGIDLAGDIDVDGTANLDNTDIDGTLAVDGTTISLDATTSLNIDNSNTSNGITVGTATSGVPISIGHTVSETTVNDNLTVTGTLTGTLATAAQGSVTSLGTLTDLTVDDVNIGAKVITMTGSTSDTAVFTAGTHGTLNIVTTDAAAAAANIQITADGTVDIDSAGILTLDSGAAINIEPASGSAILLDGTISVDAGVVTGATSITSTAFVGGLTGNVTGNTSGTAATVTTAAQGNITSLGTLTTLTVDNVIINGATIGHTGDTDLITVADSLLTVAGEVSMTTLDIGGTNVTSTAAELNLLDALDRGSILYGNASGVTAVLGQGSNGYVLTSDGTDIAWAASSVSGLASDNLSVGDAAVTLSTSSGNITIDATANNSDIIFKGTDATADITMLTLAGADAGAATFNNKIVATELDISGDVDVDGTLEADAITIGSTAIGSIYGVVAGSSSIVTTGALDTGSITSGFGTIDTGASAITTTGLISGGSLDIDNVLINGTTIGHTDDTDLITVADSLLTIDGDVTITGGTPTLTIGDADAEDAKIVFDGNAQDFHIGLDDTADDLVIGKGSALGTTPVISIADTLKTTFGGGAIGATYAVAANGNITMNFDLYTNFQITADGGNVTLLNGTGTLTEGQSGVIVLIQDGSGSRTISTGTDYEWPAATVGTISTAANAVDIIPYYIDDNDSILLGAPQLAFATPS